MISWVERVHQRSSSLMAQIAAAQNAEKEHKINMSGLIEFYTNALKDLYENEISLAQVMDSSDIVLHATSIDAIGKQPKLKEFNWLCNNAEHGLRQLGSSIFSLNTRADSKNFYKKLDIRFNGYSSGSIYAGFFINEQQNILNSDEPEYITNELKDIMFKLPLITEIVKKNKRLDEVREYIADPAHRDAALETILKFSPTGRNGIEEIYISSMNGSSEPALLNKKIRLSIKNYLMSPVLSKKRDGKFSGVIREIDLDAGRFHIRSVAGIGTIRCIFKGMDEKQAKSILGKKVAVEGVYEEDLSGKPRLMFVEKINFVKEAVQEDLI